MINKLLIKQSNNPIIKQATNNPPIKDKINHIFKWIHLPLQIASCVLRRPK